MNEFQNGEVFQFDGIHQASSMYLKDAAGLGRFDAGRLLVLEREWKAEYGQVPINDEMFSFAQSDRVFQGSNGELTFFFSAQYNCFVLLGFELKPSTRGGGNVIAIQSRLSRKMILGPIHEGVGVAACGVTGRTPAVHTPAVHAPAVHAVPAHVLHQIVMADTFMTGGAIATVREKIYVRTLVDGFVGVARLDVPSIDDYRALMTDAAEDLGAKVVERQERICDAFDDQARALQEYRFALKRSRRRTAGMMAAAAIGMAATLWLETKIDGDWLQYGLLVVFALSALVMGIGVVRNSIAVRNAVAAVRSGHAVKFIHDTVRRGPRTT